jgi:metal-responsive CopG/Arc/MetJ family transcriptional regulator
MGQTNQVGSDPVVTGFEITDVYRDFRFPSRSEAIRVAVWELVRREKQQCEDTQIMTGG